VGLADPGDLLMVGDGIETCLAAMQATQHPSLPRSRQIPRLA
jgi:hypothetical protein